METDACRHGSTYAVRIKPCAGATAPGPGDTADHTFGTGSGSTSRAGDNTGGAKSDTTEIGCRKDSSASNKSSSEDDDRDADRREQLAEDRAEFEGRIASLKVRLKLTDEQAKNWPAFENAFRDFVMNRMEQRHAFRDRKRSDNPFENMEARADFAAARAAAMKQFATAAMPFYNSLDQDQQRQLRRAALRGVMKMMHRRFERDGYGRRWQGRGDGDWGYGPRWGGRRDYGDWGYGPRWRDRDDSRNGGDDDGGYRRHGWCHRGEGMMGQRWGGRDRGDYDDRRGGSDKQSYHDDGDDNGGGRSGSGDLKPYEERF